MTGCCIGLAAPGLQAKAWLYAEHLVNCRNIRQDIDDSRMMCKRRSNMGFVESHWHIDAAIGDSVVIGRRRCQTFKPAFGGIRRDDAVHGDRRVVVDPDNVLAPGVAATFCHEAACWSGPLIGLNQGNWPVADTWHGFITQRSAK